jgi:hypothetical protein
MEKNNELYSIETSIDGIRVIHLGLALALNIGQEEILRNK